MKLLAIETCFKKTSACLYLHNTFDEDVEMEANRHVNGLPEITKSLFNKHNIAMQNLDGIIINHGPGSFTGLRVGIAFAKGLSASFGTPLYGISTLECHVRDYTPQTIAVQGLKDHCYVQHFQNAKPCGQITHIHISEVQAQGKLTTVGFHTKNEDNNYPEMPTARMLMERFLFQKPDPFHEPLYVRPVSAVIPQNMKKILI